MQSFIKRDIFFITTLGSTIVLLIILTNPRVNVLYIFAFFILFLLFVTRLLYLLLVIFKLNGKKIRRRVILLSTALTFLLMLRTTGSLSYSEVIAVAAISIIWLLYIERRFERTRRVK